MSTFSTRGGLYERAQRKYKLADGKCCVTWHCREHALLHACSYCAGAVGHISLPTLSRRRSAPTSLLAGKSLFTYAFFDRQRPEAQAFFADIYSEAVAAEPAAGHHALRQLHDAGRLLRHYTLNIDGLAEQVGAESLVLGLGCWVGESVLWGGFLSRRGGAAAVECQPLGQPVLRRTGAMPQPLPLHLHAHPHRWAWTRGTTSATPAA